MAGRSLGRVVMSYLRSQFRCQKLCFAHKNCKVMVFTPWLPPAWSFQWIYLFYRWVLALYFGSWLLYDAIIAVQQGKRFMIYLTNWGFMMWVSYLISAAVGATINFIRALVCNDVLYFPRGYSPTHRQRTESDNEEDEDEDEQSTSNCCRKSPDSTNICDKLTWFLFLVGGEVAFMIPVLFWSFLYNEDSATSPLSINVHLVNGIVALMDLWVSGVPIFLLQFVYLQAFAWTYVAFTGIYYELANKTVIYPPLDYQKDPALAASLSVGMAMVGTVVVHLIFLAQYLCRRYATARLLIKYKQKYRLNFNGSHVATGREPPTSPPPPSSSSSSSSVQSDTTPILIKTGKKNSTTYSSRESFF